MEELVYQVSRVLLFEVRAGEEWDAGEIRKW